MTNSKEGGVISSPNELSQTAPFSTSLEPAVIFTPGGGGRSPRGAGDLLTFSSDLPLSECGGQGRSRTFPRVSQEQPRRWNNQWFFLFCGCPLDISTSKQIRGITFGLSRGRASFYVEKRKRLGTERDPPVSVTRAKDSSQSLTESSPSVSESKGRRVQDWSETPLRRTGYVSHFTLN